MTDHSYGEPSTVFQLNICIKAISILRQFLTVNEL